MGVEIKDTNITMTGHSDRQAAIQKLAEAMLALAVALQEPDGAQYGVYVGNVAEPNIKKSAPRKTKVAGKTKNDV